MAKYNIRICLDDECDKIEDCLTCQQNALVICFAINFIMFTVEIYYGVLEQSASLIGDSAHNMGDAVILGSSIFLITASKLAKAKLALVKCAIWMAFGFLTLYHVGNNFITEQVPHHIPITLIGAIALIGNIISTLLLLAYKNKDVNLKSAYICCRNDALGNLLIIIAGLLIMRTGTNWPDLIVGTMIGLLVVYSAVKITKESLIILQEKKS